jgi:ketosteroid isomerase-like protein
MRHLDVVAIVQAFHKSLNDRDVPAVLDLATDDVRVGGPRGSGEGRQLIEEWISRSNLTMTPTRWFRAGDTVVVEQQAIWRDPETGAETGSQIVATVFTIEDGLIAGIARYGFLAEAVHSAGMDESNEIDAPLA